MVVHEIPSPTMPHSEIQVVVTTSTCLNAWLEGNKMETCRFEYTAGCSQEGKQQIWGFVNQGFDAPLSEDASDRQRRQWWKQIWGVRSTRQRYGERKIAMELKKPQWMRKNNKEGRKHKKKAQKKRKEKFKFTKNLLVDHLNPPTRYSKCLTPSTKAKVSNDIESQEEKNSNIFLFSLTNILHSFLSKSPKPSNNILFSNIWFEWWI